MNPALFTVLKAQIQQATGARIEIEVDTRRQRKGLRIWFAELSRQGGPIFYVRPNGLHRHVVSLEFGSTSTPCIDQIESRATEEHYDVARALIAKQSPMSELSFLPNGNAENWVVTPDLRIEVEIREIPDPNDEDAIKNTIHTVMIPMIASLAELIGYEEETSSCEGYEDGKLTEAVIKRRERNPRNRLLCLAYHGNSCKGCGMIPVSVYGLDMGDILEVHHIEPLSEVEVPKVYSPVTDLIPLCPNCHRAIHTRRPAYLPEVLWKTLS